MESSAMNRLSPQVQRLWIYVDGWAIGAGEMAPFVVGGTQSFSVECGLVRGADDARDVVRPVIREVEPEWLIVDVGDTGTQARLSRQLTSEIEVGKRISGEWRLLTGPEMSELDGAAVGVESVFLRRVWRVDALQEVAGRRPFSEAVDVATTAPLEDVDRFSYRALCSDLGPEEPRSLD